MMSALKFRSPAGRMIGGVSAVAAPVADFTGTPLTIDSGLLETCQFTDASTNTPTSWTWAAQRDGAGGYTTFSTSQNPAVTAGGGFFTAGSVYDIRLTATNAGGNDTKTRAAYLTVTGE